jgi:hypothetical protein
MERITCIRQQESPDPTLLEYPFLYLSEYRHTPRQIIGEPTEENEIPYFPECISHYYWIHQGINDEDAWRALFQYYDKNTNSYRYGFYLGECDYTGFDCQGSMNLYVSDRYEVLIERALGDHDYLLYIEETNEN